MQLVFLGAPGTGKGTQAALLAKKLSIPQVSTGDMLRDAVAKGTALGRKAKEVIDQGGLVPDEVMISLVRERLSEKDCASGFILDGFPRTESQALALDHYLGEHGKGIDLVVLLDVSSEAIVRRLSSRRVCSSCGHIFNLPTNDAAGLGECTECGGKLVQRSDDSESTVRRRLDVYRKQTESLRDYYERQGKLRVVSGDSSVSEVHSSIMEVVRRATLEK
jgi:adenylate kinase